ncbi:hypothetical protein [Clostridium sp.]|uniref:hypothetical protein n=1 Tax=Clostridium sp. TaxID=1506 RepID=UPI0028420EF9|nr:hypothetical protein [Clostridium sp.]MDR3594148.1 hypothetical protein [Clostridium sp.]
MSEIIYKIIPENYNFFPIDTKTIDGAVKILKMYVHADRISWESFENPAFIDCGSNFDSITCPFCGNNISIDVWQKMMDMCYKRSCFNNLNIFLPCCNRDSTLNDLKYQMDCGFSKFVIEVLNPVYPPCKHDLFEASKCFGKLTLKMIVSKY